MLLILLLVDRDDVFGRHRVLGRPIETMSNRKTSGEADFGRSFRVVAGPETVQARESCVTGSYGQKTRMD
jgi:hypothetical protein